MAGSQINLQAPDLRTRSLMLQRQSGVALKPRESSRLAARMYAEDETKRQGGTMQGALPREPDVNEAYAAGRGAVTPRTLAQPASAPSSALTRTPPATFEASAQRILQKRFGRAPGDNHVDISMGGPANPTPTPAAPAVSSLSEPSAAPAQPPVTPVARGATSPLTPTNSVAQGTSKDISAQPAGSTSGAAAPTQIFGGTGQYRQAFKTQDSANIYDSYVRRLFGDSQQAQEGSPAPASTVPLTRSAPAATTEIDQTTGLPRKAPTGIFSGPGHDADMNRVGRVANGIKSNVRQIFASPQRVGSPRDQDEIAAAGTP